ncbi:MAG: hypothetical protein JKY94_16880 [Rhodobacteraceae bacterium]|nr:hypothetical protein [Paracoccaceae bacterium]
MDPTLIGEALLKLGTPGAWALILFYFLKWLRKESGIAQEKFLAAHKENTESIIDSQKTRDTEQRADQRIRDAAQEDRLSSVLKESHENRKVFAKAQITSQDTLRKLCEAHDDYKQVSEARIRDKAS